MILTGGGLGGKSGKVVLWNVQTGERIAVVGNEFDQVLAADLSADQQYVAIGGPNKLVKIYATKDGKLLHSIKKHTDWVTGIAFSPDGKLLASANRSGGMFIWESAKGKEYNTLPGHKAMVTGVAFMMGVVASGSEDGMVKLWDVKEGKEIKSWTAHAGGVQSVDFTPDGRLVSSGRDKTAKVWDQTGKQLMASEPFTDIALRAEMAGERVVAGDWNGKIRVWTVADGKCVGELSSNPPSLAERLALSTNALTANEAAVQTLKQQADAAEASLKSAQAAAEASRANAETALNAAKAEAQSPEQPAKVAAAEKNLKDATAQVAALQTGGTAQPAQNFAKAKAALEHASTQIASTKGDLEKWKIAKVFQNAHDAVATSVEKQARYDDLVQAAKDAPLAVEKARADIAGAEKAVIDAPRKLAEKEALLKQTQEKLEPLKAAIVSGEAAVADKEKAKAALIDVALAANPAVGEAAKKLDRLTAEVTALRDARAAKTVGTAEYVEASTKFRAKRDELAQTQTALDGVKAKAADTPEIKAIQDEILSAMANLDKARRDVRAAAELSSAAEKAVAQAKKQLAEAAPLVAKLKSELPNVIKAAEAAKIEAEQASVIAKKEAEAAKVEAEKRRADYETLKGGAKSAKL